ncbi:Gfo/Idh/MocA family protein [Leucobacter chromiireducens]|uniref:Gfo/Idh/MocA family protein n=1 Tax=Leucobacter chromiireducens TaxID=283877 RepID=UPI000F62D5A7|nr:Gfo/Idh/MocA family oxidoreductase [Leucobacter chromiireducens]
MTSAETLRLEPDAPIRTRSHRIGVIGAGAIMADQHLEAYRQAGFPVVAIASRTRSRAAAVAERYGIETVHETPRDLILDPRVEIVDIAFPPDQQPELIRLALAQPHVRAVLAQKPLALSLVEAIALRDEAAAAGKLLSVNQNMRYDQSIRSLKQLLDRGALGQPVFAAIDMHAVPHWQTFLAEYDRLTLANMSVHHLDALRYLFGDPVEIYTAGRPDPRTEFAHTDGIVASTLSFENGVLAVSREDVWGGPREEGFNSDFFISWRVEGTEGVATGTIGWPNGKPSTISYASTSETNGEWVAPEWETHWFPHAFAGVMEQLQHSVETGTEPALTVADNVRTMALIEAGYRSLAEHRAVRLDEFDLAPTTNTK